MKESDWKLFRKLRELALERFSRNILDEIGAASLLDAKSYHQRYLDVFKLVDERNEQMAAAFNNPRRSTAIGQLALMVASGWITDEEFRQFSEETRSTVEGIVPNRDTAEVTYERPGPRLASKTEGARPA
jgi:ABC-type transport system involved in cytochrome c biogenesis ATPase subunit